MAGKKLFRVVLLFLGALIHQHSRAGGVTIITHGYDGDVTGWIAAMADQIPQYYAARFPELGTNFSIYTVTLTTAGTATLSSSDTNLTVQLTAGTNSLTLGTLGFITVDGATPVLYSPTNPPAIVTTEGAVEDWTIENRTQEVHEFHIHQIHFLMLAQNGAPLPADQQQFRDTVQVPFWSGRGPYPSITVRMDFRGRIAGDFVYHCHILDHEDAGMMAIIRVLPHSLPD